MLINVIPISNNAESAVVFSVTFEDHDSYIDQPVSWNSQLQCLRRDGLEVPEYIHALDKSACLVSLLADVTFDLSTMSVSCQFVDGSCEQWPLEGDGLLNALKKILRDVNESSREVELRRVQRKEVERKVPEPISTVSGKGTRHKKQRSLLLTLVASIIPLSSSSKRLSPPPTPTSSSTPDTLLSPRSRRRKARSELVDAFRRYAVSELSRRFPRGGYYPWIINSMLRRAIQSVDSSSKNEDEPHPFTHDYPDDSEYFSITAASLPPTPSVSDDEDDSDTDSSSLDTPTSSQFNLTFRPTPSRLPPPPLSPAPGPPSHFVRKHHRNHSITSISLPLPVDDQAEHTSSVGKIRRLRRLLALEIERQEQLDEELDHHYSILEAHSRRRAYLNKELHGADMSSSINLAMTLPTVPSPLGMYCWSCDHYEYAPDESSDGEQPTDFQSVFNFNDYDRSDLAIKRTKTSRRRNFTPFGATAVPRLFPISECEEEAVTSKATEDEKDAIASGECTFEQKEKVEISLDCFEVEFEDGLKYPLPVSGSDGGVDDEKCEIYTAPALLDDMKLNDGNHRPQRRRTSSMYAQSCIPQPKVDPIPPYRRQRRRSLPPPLRITTVPLIPLVQMVDEDAEKPPVYTEIDLSAGVPVFDEETQPLRRSPKDSKFVSEEFTLAMDLPFSVRAEDRDIFAVGMSCIGVGLDHAVERELDNWGEM